MITVNQVYEALQAIAPLELAEHWDNPGLLVDCGGQMHRVVAALDITPEVVAEADVYKRQVLPIAASVLVLCFTIAPVSPSILLCFLLGAAMIVVGIMFLSLIHIYA